MSAAPALASRPPRSAGRLLAVLSFFTLFAGDFWRDALGWPAFLVLAGVLAVLSGAWLIAKRPRVGFGRWPKLLLLFVAYAGASIAWSQYAGASALGLLAILAAGTASLAPALLLSWHELVDVLAAALKWVLGLSLLFELLVSLVIRHHVLPLAKVPGVDYTGKLPDAFYWSRDNLFKGEQIQGIVGNGDLLAMCALIGLIVLGIQLADARRRGRSRAWGVAWLALAAVELVLARSATVAVAAFATAVVLGFALWARVIPQSRRWPLYGTAAALLVVGVGGILGFWTTFTGLLGKDADLTGRTDIWASVIGLAQQHPWFGWGWVSYWVPWAEPFKGLAVRHGVEYLQAHDAWLDVWMQLGVVGLVIFGLLALSSLGRSWFTAVDRPRLRLADDEPFDAARLLPLLLLTALLAQSIAESRLLVESGWALLVLVSVRTKLERA